MCGFKREREHGEKKDTKVASLLLLLQTISLLPTRDLV